MGCLKNKIGILRILISAVIALTVMFYAGSVLAADNMSLDFEPVGGGKFIYCNNTEGIFRSSLADSSNDTPRYTMTNENLMPDRYYLYLSHINYTYETDDNGWACGLGFDVELDVEITAKEDSVLKIYRAAFETPKVSRYIDENGTVRYESQTWGAENAAATMLGTDIYRLGSDTVFKNNGYTEKTVSIKKGETVWLSSYIDNYDACTMVQPVFMTADTELVSGLVDMNVVELKSKDGKIGDRSDFDRDKVSFGTYLRDTCYKGIADSLPEVEVSLDYTVDDGTLDGEYLPVTVTNQYAVDGVSTESWVTHLNPLDDIWSKYITAESDMLALEYYDPSKLTYYGSNVPESEKSDVWIFDTKHSNTKDYISESGVSAADYSPNYELDVTESNEDVACSLGNYGVTERYYISITNDGENTRYFNYDVTSSSNVIVTMRDKNGNLADWQEVPVITKTGSAYVKTTDTCAYAELPPGETTEFILEVLLPVNYFGGITNAFRISDTKPSFELLTSEKSEYADFVTIENTYYDEFMSKADDYTKELLGGNLGNFEAVKTAYGYMLRFKEWDASPGSVGDFISLAYDIYFLDENFSYSSIAHFDSLPMRAVFSDGKFIVTLQSGERYFSIDGSEWSEAFWPESEDETLDKILVRLNGEYLEFDTDPVLLNDRTLVPMRLIFESLGMSVLWSDELQKAIASDGNTTVSFTIGESRADVNGKSFEMDTYPILQDDRTLIPLRFLSESLGYRVTWNDVARVAVIEDYPPLPTHSQSYYVIYKEGYRDNRVEAAVFDIIDATDADEKSLVWNGSIVPKSGYVDNDLKFYFDEETETWVAFESGYGTISNYATAFIMSNLPAEYY